MNALAEQYAEYEVGSIFIYTHEAHPGENYPHHTSMEQKFAHARALRDLLGVTRPILVDALDGACHRAYGSMPNMSWIFNRAGIPIYKADWTDSNSVANAIQYFVDVTRRRREKERLVPFRVERLDFRTSDQEEFYKGLERSGPKAVREFREAGL
ncbi:MAG: hypothetical protein D6706_19940 [Chloroflexi bacterium]|nr:MAG: hypothetical protein D6706_19940 [Chloroflexota bacterium]